MSNAPDQFPADGTLVSWQEGIGDDTKYHIAHVSAEGVTLVLKQKDQAKWTEVVTTARMAPEDAPAMLREVPKAVHLKSAEIAKATYVKDLNQLVLFDANQKKTKLPPGKELANVFVAIKEHLGGTASEEEADAWSVMQGPFVTLSVIAVIGGFLIWFTTISDPSQVATGRKAGMKNLLNWLGYTIGPFWMSTAVGSLAAIVLAMMIYQLVKRPIRQILQFSS